MATLKAVRSAQYPLVSEFVFNHNDTMADTSGTTKTFGSVHTDDGTFEVINLPTGAVVIGGALVVETQGVGPTVYTVSVGNSDSATAYLAATDCLAAAGTTTALTGLGLTAGSGKNIRITVNTTVANASAGKFRLRVEYIIDGRANEVIPG